MKKKRIIPILLDNVDLFFLILLFVVVMLMIADMGVAVELYNKRITPEDIQEFFGIVFQLFLSYVCIRVSVWLFTRNDTTTIWLEDFNVEIFLNYHPEDLMT